MTAWGHGSRGPFVEDYQADLVALGYDLRRSTRRDGSLDGIVGPEVLAVTETHIAANFAAGNSARKGDASRVYDVATIPEWVRLYVAEAATALKAPMPAPRNTGLAHLGAWGGRSALRADSWRGYLDTAIAAGLTEVSLMLNDCTGKNLAFHLFESPRQIAHVVGGYRASGIRVTLTSWLRPEVAFIDEMFDTLFDLAAMSRAERVELDAEEPWTTGRYEPHDRCLARIGERVTDAPVPWGVTAIVYHHVERVGPLVRMADFYRGQAYATKRQTARHLLPGTIVDTCFKLTTQRYGDEVAARSEPAIALYDRAGAGGLSAVGAVRADLRAIERNPNTSATCGWSLYTLRRSRTLQAELRRWRTDAIDAQRMVA